MAQISRFVPPALEPILPANGVLVRDRTPSYAAIRRQKQALAALREGEAQRGHTCGNWCSTRNSRRRQSLCRSKPRTPGFDDDKKIAVAMPLGRKTCSS